MRHRARALATERGPRRGVTLAQDSRAHYTPSVMPSSAYARTSLVALAVTVCACGGEPQPSPSSPTATLQCPRSGRPDGGARAVAEPGPPATPKHEVTDTYDGVAVVDPYQWLESNDPAVAEWSAAQNAYARSKLDAFPERAPIRARIAELLESQSADYSELVHRNGTLFALE